MYYALQACKDFDLKKDQKCVVILPDSVRNYMYVRGRWGIVSMGMRLNSSVENNSIVLKTMRFFAAETVGNIRFDHNFFIIDQSICFNSRMCFVL